MLRPLLTALTTLFVLACSGRLAATWSIIIVDTRTGEVALGSATCLTGWDLRTLTAVLVVGKGGACAQSFVDFSGNNRLIIFDGFKNGTDPQAILALLAQKDPQHQTRQYGIVDTQGRAIGFTGTGAFDWKGNVTGRIGTLVYAIQGNILTGAAVVSAAETALRATNGDLAARMMAAMEAARSMGGDGRCSCTSGPPTSCGAPPPNFTKSADIGFMIIGRQGDVDGVCNGGAGCATGTYYQNLNVITNGAGPDPVLTLKTMYDKWRRDLGGRPDHHLSAVSIPSGTLPADGATRAAALLTLRDVDGRPLTAGGARVQVVLEPGSTAQVTIGAVTDNKDGTYSIPLTAGSKVGTAQLRITVDDGRGPVLLSPRTEVVVNADRLWVSDRSLQAARGGDLEFVINQGPALANRVYMLMVSNNGSSPGTVLGPNQTLPLNLDLLFWTVFWSAANNSIPGFYGTLDATGRRVVRLPMPPGLYALPVPSGLTFATAVFAPIDGISNPVEVKLAR